MEKSVIFEEENKYVLKNICFPTNNTSDFDNIDTFCGDAVCRIYLDAAPNKEFEAIAMGKDGENYSPSCFFIEATFGRDNIEEDFMTSNWFLHYVLDDGETVFLDDTAELLDAWDYLREHYEQYKKDLSVDGLISNAQSRVEKSESASVGKDEVEFVKE